MPYLSEKLVKQIAESFVASITKTLVIGDQAYFLVDEKIAALLNKKILRTLNRLEFTQTVVENLEKIECYDHEVHFGDATITLATHKGMRFFGVAEIFFDSLEYIRVFEKLRHLPATVNPGTVEFTLVNSINLDEMALKKYFLCRYWQRQIVGQKDIRILEQIKTEIEKGEQSVQPSIRELSAHRQDSHSLTMWAMWAAGAYTNSQRILLKDVEDQIRTITLKRDMERKQPSPI